MGDRVGVEAVHHVRVEVQQLGHRASLGEAEVDLPQVVVDLDLQTECRRDGPGGLQRATHR